MKKLLENEKLHSNIFDHFWGNSLVTSVACLLFGGNAMHFDLFHLSFKSIIPSMDCHTITHIIADHVPSYLAPPSDYPGSQVLGENTTIITVWSIFFIAHYVDILLHLFFAGVCYFSYLADSFYEQDRLNHDFLKIFTILLLFC